MFELSGYEPNVKASVAFLKLLHVRVNKSTVSETLHNHPDWPSLLSISDSFSRWKIPNAAGRIDKKDIDALPVPFLAHTSDPEFPLIIVINITDGIVTYRGKEHYVKEKKQSKADFFNIWEGVYFIAEPSTESGEKDFDVNRKKQMSKKTIPLFLLALLVLALFFVFKHQIVPLQLSASGLYVQFALLLTGVIFSALLLWYEIDKNNPALKKVCTGIAKGNCDSILSSKQAKVFSWLSWSEVGFFYFMGSLLNLVFASTSILNACFVLAWLSILALPYTFFSIYYQWRVARQWCILCLGVQAILAFLALNSFVSYRLNLLSHGTPFLYWCVCVCLFTLPVLAWYTIKPSLQELQKTKTKRQEYMRMKFNKDVFDVLLKKQKQLTLPTEDLGILLGNPSASNELIKVCNPYCGPCSRAHPEIEKLLEQSDNLKVRIIFTAKNDDRDLTSLPVKHLLAVASINNKIVTKQALDDWYLPDEKEYKVFSAKYPLLTKLEQQDEKVEKMAEWCKNEKILATPTIFINRYQIPDQYQIQDLSYFLLE